MDPDIEGSNADDDDIVFETSLFDHSQCLLFPSYSDIKLYTEADAITFLQNLPEPVEPFWLRSPVLNPDQVRKLYRLADSLVSICRDQQVPIWIDFGTLLGAVRHKGLIPWDDDLDFSMMKSHSKQFERCVVPRLRASGYGVVGWWYGGYRVFPLDGDPITQSGQQADQQCKYPFADLFWVRVDKTTKDTLVYWGHRARCLWPSGLTVDDLWPLRDYEFGPISLPGPNHCKDHLDSLYGDDWAKVVYQERQDHKGGDWRVTKIRVKLDKFPALVPC